MKTTDHQPMFTRPLRLLVALAVLLVPLFGLLGAGTAHAATTYTVSDGASCTVFLSAIGADGNANGESNDEGQCYIYEGTLPAGHTLNVEGDYSLRPQGDGGTAANFINNGTVNINTDGGLYNAGILENRGTLNLNNQALNGVVINNYGTITISADTFNGGTINNSGTIIISATLHNRGTIDNSSQIQVGCDGDLVNSVQGPDETIQGTFTGNAVEFPCSDSVPPTAKPGQSPEAKAGWNTSDVTVSWNWADNTDGKGIDPDNCVQSSTSSGEGTIELTASCKDLAGNTGTAFYTVKVDKTAPRIRAAATSDPTATGWYTSAVTVHFTCEDSGSGIPAGACPADQMLTTDGVAVSSTAQTVTDAAGNPSAASNVITVQLDTTKPTLAPVVRPNPVLLGGSATATPNADDATSLVAVQSCGNVTTSSVGTKTVQCSATDTAGNTNNVNASYQVLYPWSGFFQPVDNAPALNSVKAGSAVPVKFSLGGNQGLNIFVQGYPASKQIACSASAPVDAIEQTTTASTSSLQYDATSRQYTYVWKTDKSWAGTCRQLTVGLVDGTDHVANFQFK